MKLIFSSLMALSMDSGSRSTRRMLETCPRVKPNCFASSVSVKWGLILQKASIALASSRGVSSCLLMFSSTA